jgi:hypothetical protein
MRDKEMDQKAFDDLVYQAATAGAKSDAQLGTYRDLLEVVKRMPPPRNLGVLHVAPGLLEFSGGELAAKVPPAAVPFAGIPVVVNPALPPGEWRLVPRTSMPVLSPAAPPVPTDDGFRVTARFDLPRLTLTRAELGLPPLPTPATRWQRIRAWLRRFLARV